MTRAAIDTAEATETEDGLGGNLNYEPGMSGYSSVAVPTEGDPRVQAITEELLARAREIRPLLREQQAETERNGVYSKEVHEFFIEHGFYRMLAPLKFGGFELTVSAFYQVIAEVSRSCPSSGWALSLGAGHSLTLGSYWSEQAQREVLEEHGFMVAPASGQASDLVLDRVEGGWNLSGVWRYCSGAPYSTHFMPMLQIPGPDGEDIQSWGIVRREDYKVLDDWGRIMGMRGSGSNGIEIKNAFVPDHMIVEQDWGVKLDKPSIGFEVHGNPLYSGVFSAFAEGEVASTSVGLGYAAVDEFERIIMTTRRPRVKNGPFRADHLDWQRHLGLALGKLDAAMAILAEGGELYSAYAKRLTDGVEPFSAARSLRLSNTYFVAEQLAWEVVESLLRTAGSRYSADGETLQRYFRDMVATRTRTDQFEFAAADAATTHLNALVDAH